MRPESEPEFLYPEWAAPAGVRVAVSTRIGGFSNPPWEGLNLGEHVGDDPVSVQRNRALLRAALGLPAEPCWLRQVHGIAIADAEGCEATPEADGAIARRAGVVCAVLTADCLPVVLAARDGSEVAVAHCGWRGLAAGILARAVGAFHAAPGQLVAWLGPAIGPAAFEVGSEVREQFLCGAPDRNAVEAAFTQGDPGRGRYFADLYRLARAALATSGVTVVHGGGWCTVNDHRRFYSYRRDGQTGRFATLAWIDPAQ